MTTTTDQTTTVIDADTLKAWFDRHDDVVVIDVRSAAEFESLHIRGSYNVPLQLLSEHTQDVAQRVGRRVVLVCHSGVRAEQARQRLHEVGMDSALVLDGGAPAFAAAGGDVVRGEQRWAMDRQVRMVDGTLVTTGLLAGELVSPKLRMVAGAVGAGLAFSAATNTCAMGAALAKMPWNRGAQDPAAHEAIGQLPTLG
ncbi:sulfurtransferase [Ornithinimicrobium sp. CNJ-824]|uniref:rhodanese-like domain-containing protein n=1 Tax=Ornithinimicrobium sp. CNJ-824 TaxID=1904966 RepID=UPI00095C248F|nr:rhodanese-like domain-containing protein [Ornithinimicrobium sp. CNJ-824]OLT20180.1 sulfurtransferase [Ornithinimicrobium sp. CNJ-824]